MDKQKQMIEEMAKVLHDGNAHKYADWVEYTNADLALALKLYNAGYRKIPENAVVLTEEELKEKIDCCDVSMIHHDDDGKRYIEYEKYEDFTDRLGKRIQQLKGQLKQAHKETAEKFAERLKADGQCGYSMGIKIYTIEEKGIDEIAKEITEGEKEISNETV